MATEKKTVKKAPAKKAPAKKVAAKKAPAKKVTAKKTVKAAKPAKKIVKAKPAAKAKVAKKVAPKTKKTAAKKPAKKIVAKKKPAIGKAKKKVALKTKKLVAKPKALPKRLPKPWPIARIRSLMEAWGMSQVDFAIFAGVSYDSVTSWCRGRRHLVNRATAEHLEKAEKIAHSRKFKPTGGKPWAGFKNYMKNESTVKVDTDLELKTFDGTFKLEVVETTPGKFRNATKNEKVAIKMSGKNGKVALHIGRQKIDFDGVLHHMGGAPALELIASPKDKDFLAGRAGCITFVAGLLRIGLWSTGGYPVRMVGVPAK